MSEPVAMNQEVAVQARFRCSGFGVPVVTPGGQRWHGHQNGFSPSTRLQAEQGAAIQYQIEFHITSASVSLEFALTFTIWQFTATGDDRQIGIDETVTHAALQGKAVFKTACVEIIKEDAADTTRFLAMLQIEIVVTPLFIVRVHIIAEGLQRVATGAVEMLHIFLEAVI